MIRRGIGARTIRENPTPVKITDQLATLWRVMRRWPATVGYLYSNCTRPPLDPLSGGREMRVAYEGIVFPGLRAFEPDLIMISAGFDAHRDDPLANLNWVEDDFGWVTTEICRIAAQCCAGRVVSVLEGGYDLDALASGVRVHLDALIAHVEALG